MRLAEHAAEVSGVAQFAVGGPAVLGMSAGALRHLQLAVRLSGPSWRCGGARRSRCGSPSTG